MLILHICILQMFLSKETYIAFMVYILIRYCILWESNPWSIKHLFELQKSDQFLD